jgi:hypothetical protein
MFFHINGLSIKPLEKAISDSPTILVDIIANHLTEDEDGETVLREAFDEETINSFMQTGIVDYWHETRNPHLSKEEKNKFLLGKPTAFRWENGKPVVTAALTKSHEIVKDMLPHLEANQPVYAASIGGSKMVLEAMGKDGKKHRIIPKIKWDHLAIAPAPYVINRAGGVNVRLLQKANELLCEFDGVDSFIRNREIIGKEEELRKALEAPASAADLYSTPGGVVTKQSTEKKIVSLTEDDGLDLIDTIIGIKNKKIPLKKADYLKHFDSLNKSEFGNKSFNLITKYFKLRKE